MYNTLFVGMQYRTVVATVYCYMGIRKIFIAVYSGKFSRFSRAEQSMRKLKLGETPTPRYFTCKACGGYGFLALKREHYF